jgi:hypothetical protein
LTGSQYSQDTATILANQLLAGSTKDTTIAVISAPSAFVQLKNIIVSTLIYGKWGFIVLIEWQAASDRLAEEKPKIYLLEFDERFNIFDEFVFYDFHNPFKLPRMLLTNDLPLLHLTYI